MTPPTLFITGAPESNSLKWESSSLLDSFTGPIARFAGIPQSEDESKSSPSSTGKSHAAWRNIELSRQHLSTGYSQINGWIDDSREDGDTAFFAPANLSFTSINHGEDISTQPPSQGSTTESLEEVLSQFYEHSFAVHADMPSSQISAHTSESQSDGSSFTSSASQLLLPRPSLPHGAQLATLASIPNARYLESIHPQTVTVNLIVGIITVSDPRALNTRHGAAVDIVEFLVGDESKSGFGINYWLNSAAPPKPKLRNLRSGKSNPVKTNTKSGNTEEVELGEGVRDLLKTLRPQDIVLLTNVALSSFRGRVFGQSLRRGMTKIHLLFRQRIDRLDVGGCYRADEVESTDEVDILLEKTRKVREWVNKFVGARVVVRRDAKGKKGTGRVEILKEVLPPDTQ